MVVIKIIDSCDAEKKSNLLHNVDLYSGLKSETGDRYFTGRFSGEKII
mgnify:CR=1 FL=1